MDVVTLLLKKDKQRSSGAHEHADTNENAFINRADNDGDNLLINAALFGHATVVKLLLQNGADIDSMNNKGESAIVCASKQGHDAVAALLLKRGAQTEALSSSGEDASESDDEDATSDSEGSINPADEDSDDASDSSDEGDDQSETSSADNVSNSADWSPLMTAAAEGETEEVKCLLKGRADVDEQLPDGTTALHLVCKEGHVDVVKFLVENGASVDLTDEDGESPLMFAADYGELDVVTFLLEKGRPSTWLPTRAGLRLWELRTTATTISSGCYWREELAWISDDRMAQPLSTLRRRVVVSSLYDSLLMAGQRRTL